MIFFIGSKLGWLIHTTCLAAVCIWIQGILLKDESCLSTEDSWLGEDVFRSQKPLQAALSENLAVHQSLCGGLRPLLALQKSVSSSVGFPFTSVLRFRKLHSYKQYFRESLIKR